MLIALCNYLHHYFISLQSLLISLLITVFNVFLQTAVETAVFAFRQIYLLFTENTIYQDISKISCHTHRYVYTCVFNNIFLGFSCYDYFVGNHEIFILKQNYNSVARCISQRLDFQLSSSHYYFIKWKILFVVVYTLHNYKMTD